MLPSRMPRSPTRRRPWGMVLLAAIVAATCVRLGFWQVARLHEREAFVAAVHHGLARAPEPLGDVVASTGTRDPDAARYRRVNATGTYDETEQVVLYGRGAAGGADANHVVEPLVLPDGTAIEVDRGSVPLADNSPPVPGASPPSGAVRVTGILLPSEGGLPGEGSAPEHRITETTRVDLAALAAQSRHRLLPWYLLLQSQTPAQATLPRPASFALPPAPPHLSYAIQWFSFATIALVGAAILWRRERRSREPTPGPPVP